MPSIDLPPSDEPWTPTKGPIAKTFAWLVLLGIAIGLGVMIWLTLRGLSVGG